MSKAFTSEETPDEGPVLRTPPQLAPGEVRYITPEGHSALVASLETLREQRATSHALVDLDQRIALLEGTLNVLTVRSPDEAPDGKVAFGTWVTVEDESGQETTWRIVGPDEADARRGLVSVNAPVARALLGHEPGDSVEVQRPGGATELTILEVRKWGQATFPPEK